MKVLNGYRFSRFCNAIAYYIKVIYVVFNDQKSIPAEANNHQMGYNLGNELSLDSPATTSKQQLLKQLVICANVLRNSGSTP